MDRRASIALKRTFTLRRRANPLRHQAPERNMDFSGRIKSEECLT